MKSADDYLSYLAGIRNLSAHTVTAYREDLALLDAFMAGRRISEADLTGQDLRAFIVELSEAGHAPSSVNRILAAVSGYFRYQVRYGIRASSPADGVKRLKEPKYLPTVMFEREVARIIESPKDDFWGKRDRALFELLYSTGCRVSEVADLTVTSLSLRERTARVRGKGDKERIVFLNGHTVEALSAYFAERNAHLPAGKPQPFVFINHRGGRLTQRGIAYILYGYCVTSGIDKNVSPHAFRHSFATHLLNRGADIRVVQELLGHASLSTTQKYTHLGFAQLRDTYDQAFPHARNGGGKVSVPAAREAFSNEEKTP